MAAMLALARSGWQASLRQPAWPLLAVTLACWAAVALALVSQYQFGMLPCPWCTLQRLIFLLLGAAALLAAVLGPLSHWARRGLAGLAAVLSVSGMAAALWQHFVAAASASCNLTWADRILDRLGLFELAPAVFEPLASCAEASVNLLGVPYALWSWALFALCGLLCVPALRGGAARGA